MAAAYSDAVEVAELLIEKGADIDAKDKTGSTALMWAARDNSLEMVKLLIEKGADVMLENNEGNTALICAQIRGYEKIIAVLEEYEIR